MTLVDTLDSKALFASELEARTAKNVLLTNAAVISRDLSIAKRLRDSYEMDRLMELELLDKDALKAYGSTVAARAARVRSENEAPYLKVEELEYALLCNDRDIKINDSTLAHCHFVLHLMAIEAGVSLK